MIDPATDLARMAVANAETAATAAVPSVYKVGHGEGNRPQKSAKRKQDAGDEVRFPKVL